MNCEDELGLSDAGFLNPQIPSMIVTSSNVTGNEEEDVNMPFDLDYVLTEIGNNDESRNIQVNGPGLFETTLANKFNSHDPLEIYPSEISQALRVTPRPLTGTPQPPILNNYIFNISENLPSASQNSTGNSTHISEKTPILSTYYPGISGFKTSHALAVSPRPLTGTPRPPRGLPPYPQLAQSSQSLALQKDLKTSSILSLPPMNNMEDHSDLLVINTDPKTSISTLNENKNSACSSPHVEYIPNPIAIEAKQLYIKRTRTLFNWIYPNADKQVLPKMVEDMWEALPAVEKNIYVEQVIAKDSKDWQIKRQPRVKIQRDTEKSPKKVGSEVRPQRVSSPAVLPPRLMINPHLTTVLLPVPPQFVNHNHTPKKRTKLSSLREAEGIGENKEAKSIEEGIQEVKTPRKRKTLDSDNEKSGGKKGTRGRPKSNGNGTSKSPGAPKTVTPKLKKSKKCGEEEMEFVDNSDKITKLVITKPKNYEIIISQEIIPLASNCLASTSTNPVAEKLAKEFTTIDTSLLFDETPTKPFNEINKKIYKGKKSTVSTANLKIGVKDSDNKVDEEDFIQVGMSSKIADPLNDAYL